MVLVKGHSHAMALDQSALVQVLEALKAAEVDDRIRQAAETIYQALIEAELTAVTGAHLHQRTEAQDILDDEHLRARGAVRYVSTREHGPVAGPAPTPRLLGRPAVAHTGP
jgi:crotonobetainyl-CoA:carnitine CoA-transferase CaiB-like acyl-CoA transferase